MGPARGQPLLQTHSHARDQLVRANRRLDDQLARARASVGPRQHGQAGRACFQDAQRPVNVGSILRSKQVGYARAPQAVHTTQMGDQPQVQSLAQLLETCRDSTRPRARRGPQQCRQRILGHRELLVEPRQDAGSTRGERDVQRIGRQQPPQRNEAAGAQRIADQMVPL